MQKSPNCINTGGTRWITTLPQTRDVQEALLLHEQGRPAPLLRIVRDVRVSGVEGIKFTPDGNHVIWGSQNGTLTACDLNEVSRRLTALGLGG